MYKLRRLRSDKPTPLLRRLANSYSAVLKANPDEHAWWFAGQGEPRMVDGAVDKNGKPIDCVVEACTSLE